MNYERKIICLIKRNLTLQIKGNLAFLPAVEFIVYIYFISSPCDLLPPPEINRQFKKERARIDRCDRTEKPDLSKLIY